MLLISSLFYLKVRRNRYFIQIFSFTEAEWLDVVEIEFQPGQDKGTVAKVNVLLMK